MPSHKERIIIEYFGDDNYHIYFQNSEKVAYGCSGSLIRKILKEWMEKKDE